MLDSEDTVDDASPEACACPCGCEAFELAVGYAMVDVVPASGEFGDERDNPRGQMVSVGARCVRDGGLGVYADWKIDYGPTARLFDRA
jgi:hypothetical protein